MKRLLSILLTGCVSAFGAATGTNWVDNLVQTHTGTTTNYFDNLVQLHTGTSTQYFDNVVSINGTLTAPTFVTAASNSATSGASLTISSFTVSGSNPLLLVLINERSSLGARTVSTCRANGSDMTQLVTTNYLDTKGNAYIYWLANPSTGDIVVTLNTSINSVFAVTALLFNGSATVDSGGASYSTSARTAVSLTPTVVATDLIADILCGATSWTPQGTLRATAGSTFSACSSTNAAPITWSGSSTVVSHLAAVVHGM